MYVQELYKLGARRLALLDIVPAGCVPSQRAITANGECDANGNSLSQMFNALLRTEIAKAVVASMPFLKYSIASLYNTYSDMIAVVGKHKHFEQGMVKHLVGFFLKKMQIRLSHFVTRIFSKKVKMYAHKRNKIKSHTGEEWLNLFI